MEQVNFMFDGRDNEIIEIGNKIVDDFLANINKLHKKQLESHKTQ